MNMNQHQQLITLRFCFPSVIKDVTGRIRPTPPHSIVDRHEVMHDDISSCRNSGLMRERASVRAHVLALGTVKSKDQRQRAVLVLH